MTIQDHASDLTRFQQRLLTDLLDAHRTQHHTAAAPVLRPSRRPRPAWARRALVALAATALVVGGTVSTAAILDEPVVIPFHLSSPVTAPVGDVPAEIRDNFAVFRDQRADPVDASHPQNESHAGINAALARTIQTPLGRVTVVPGNEDLCFQLSMPGGAGGPCQPFAKAIEGTLVLTTRGDGPLRAEAVGVVPDDVSAVALAEPDGSRTTRPVAHNVWTAERTRADHAQLLSKDGRVLGTINIP